MKRHIEINVMTTEELVKAESIINRAFRKSYNVYGAHRDYYSERKEYDLHVLQLTLEANWGTSWKTWAKQAIIPRLMQEKMHYTWEPDDEDEEGTNYLSIWGNLEQGL